MCVCVCVCVCVHIHTCIEAFFGKRQYMILDLKGRVFSVDMYARVEACSVCVRAPLGVLSNSAHYRSPLPL